MTFRPRPVPWLASVIVLASCSGGGEETQRADLVAVTRGKLTVSVTESGEIRAAKSTTVQNEMEGNSTVIFIIDEGTMVEKGTKLVELDASSQIERRATQKITVERAEAAVVNAAKNLEILRKEVAAANEAAANNHEFAKMDLQKFYGAMLSDGKREMGEREQSIKAEEAEIDLAKSALKLAEDRHKWSLKLYAKDFITKEDLDKDRLDYESKKTRLTLAENRLDILRKYTHVKTERQLKQAEKDAELELQRTIAKGEAQITQAVADHKSKVAELKLATERLENLERQIKNAVVRAPTPGIVVYASEGDRWRRRTIELGASVRERQNLIVLPDTSRMLAVLKVQEVVIDKIKRGLPALIKIDTAPTPLPGQVLRRAPLPDSASRMSNPDLKEYKTTVEIFGNNEDKLLRPNMSATVEIVVAELDDVLSIPQQAVFSQGQVQYVWLNEPAGPVATRIETGDHNESMVVITKGLKEGQQVFLVEPAGLKAPDFPQPAKPEVKVPKPGTATAKEGAGRSAPRNRPDRDTANGEDPSGDGQARPRGGNGGQGGRRPGGRRGGNPAAMAAVRAAANAFKEKVKASNPDLAAKIDAAGQGWMMNASIKSELEGDSVLAEPFRALQSEMRKAFGSGRRRGNRGQGTPDAAPGREQGPNN
ncbi:MAG: hypothetical protein KDC87_05540 [Planctomycetes bacterium]|nr:hypothetical protein [Planctomycetota bacterium]MCB9870855.1 hypothetical protein [Planctomycetota bacterium]